MKNLILLIPVFILLGCGAPVEEKPKHRGDNTNDKLLAYNFAIDHVKNNLKSPGSAKFPGASEKLNHVKFISRNQYEITSWVDSQNSFGALIRTEWKCKVRFQGDKVYFENLEFL